MSTFYYKPKVQTRLEKSIDDAKIRSAIEIVQKDLPTSGYRTMQRYLRREHGIKCGETRLRRIMKEHCLQARIKKKFVQTTMSRHDEVVHPYCLPRPFSFGSGIEPNSVALSRSESLP